MSANVVSEPAAIYLDHAATTGLDPAVRDAMEPFMGTQAGNASSLHRDGVRVALAVEKARMRIANRLGARPDEIVITSGGTEANNLALKGTFFARGSPTGHIVTTQVEHPSVAEPVHWLEACGVEVTRVPVDAVGLVDPGEVEQALRPDTVLVTLLHGNNEIGTVQPLHEVGAICRARGVLLHADACQSFTKVPLDVSSVPVDLLALNAHKLHGPTGVGALYVRQGVELVPIIHGGGHEGGLRAGTLNAAAIVGFGEAVRQAVPARVEYVAALRQRLVESVRERLPTVRLNGPESGGLCHVVSLTFPGHDGRKLLQQLDRRGIRVSVGSACSANRNEPSAVLRAIGLSAENARSTLRFSLGRYTTAADVDRVVRILVEVVAEEGP